MHTENCALHQEAHMPFDVFISYSHHDQELSKELGKHLSNLRRQNVITSWYDGDISPGTEWKPQVMEHLDNATIILLLISADFMDSDFCYSLEMTQAIARHDADQARVIPIILRPTDWKGAPFAKLKVLRRNPFFTGREYLITHLHDYLHATKATTLTQAQAISGLGGIGKTQIAIEYAYRCRDDYRAVLWARAATRDTLIADFQAIAAMLDLPEQKVADQSMVIAAVKRWLISHSGWLLILDNADDVEMASDFLPLGGDGHILLTTRAQAVGSIANSIEVEKMESAEGMLLLLRRARILVSDGLLNQATEADRERAKAIFVALDGLPLLLPGLSPFNE